MSCRLTGGPKPTACWLFSNVVLGCHIEWASAQVPPTPLYLGGTVERERERERERDREGEGEGEGEVFSIWGSLPHSFHSPIRCFLGVCFFVLVLFRCLLRVDFCLQAVDFDVSSRRCLTSCSNPVPALWPAQRRGRRGGRGRTQKRGVKRGETWQAIL